MPVIPGLRSLRQEDCKSEANLSYTARPVRSKEMGEETKEKNIFNFLKTYEILI